jgi:hypothetical protein
MNWGNAFNMSKFIFFLVFLFIIACKAGGDNNSSSQANISRSNLMLPMIAGQQGLLSGSGALNISNNNFFGLNSAKPAITIKANRNYFYDNATIDSQLLSVFIANIFSGFNDAREENDDSESSDLRKLPKHGDRIQYSILQDGHNNSIPVTLEVSVDNFTGARIYVGTFDGIDNGFDGSNYQYNYFKITLNADKTFTFENVIFIDEFVVNDDHSIGNGWQWFIHSTIDSGTINKKNYDGSGFTHMIQSATAGGVIDNSYVQTSRYHKFEIKGRRNTYGIAITPFLGPNLHPPEDIILNKNINSYIATCESINHTGNPGVAGYVYTNVKTGFLNSTFIGNQPSWVSTWWADNP